MSSQNDIWFLTETSKSSYIPTILAGKTDEFTSLFGFLKSFTISFSDSLSGFYKSEQTIPFKNESLSFSA